jgi:DNA-binding SARP family transcriptional activator
VAAALGRTAAGPGIRVDVLGPLEARLGGERIDIGPRRHREVLATLVLQAGRSVAVDTVLDQVWGEVPTSPSTLHSIISRLRGRLGEQVIVTDAGGYRLAVEPEAIDAARFTDLVAQARAVEDQAQARERVLEALSLWRGAALGDVRTPVAEAEGLRLEGMRLEAEELLAELNLELGRHADVVDRVPTLVGEHPTREGLRASLMLALYRSGRQVDALALYDEARDTLAEELGLDPGPALQRLHARILRQDPDLQVVRTPGVATHPQRDNGMVGRHDQLAELVASLRLPAPGPLEVSVVTGEAGIGKTRLVEEAAAAAAHGHVAWGRCWDHDGRPSFWPWEQALTALADALDPEVLSRALSGRAAPAALLLAGVPSPAVRGGEGPEVAKARLYDAVAAFLTAVSAERPVVVVLEDLHWADDESIELIEVVATSVRAARVALVATIRDPADGPGAQRVVAALARAPRVRRLALRGLDVPEVRQLVTQRIGTEVADGVAAALHARTEGNPFYIAELAQLLDEERRASGRADVPVPTSVSAVLELRLRRFTPAEREVLEAAAVVGRAFPLGLLADVLRRPRFDVADALDAAVRAGLVAPELHGAEQRFTHALVQETIVAGLGPQRRAGLHARVAAALEGYGADDETRTAAIAHHYAEAGDAGAPARAVDWLLRAAAYSEERLALRDAERWVRQALDQVGMVTGSEAAQLELEVLVRLGSLLTLRLGYNDEDVARHRRRALALAEPVGDAVHLLSALWGTWGNALVSGDLGTAEETCDRLAGVAELTGDRLLLLAARVASGQTSWHRGRFDQARTELAEAVALADDQEDSIPLDLFLQHPGVQARGWLSVVLAIQGDSAASNELAGQVEAQVAALDHTYTTVYAGILEGLRRLWCDQPEDALAAASRAGAAAAEHGFAQLAAFALIPEGAAVARTGDPERGEALLRRAVAAFESLPSGHMFGHLMGGLLAEAQLLSGRPGEALGTVDRAIERSHADAECFHLVDLHVLRGRIRAALGSDPVEDLEAATTVARTQHVDLAARFPSARR